MEQILSWTQSLRKWIQACPELVVLLTGHNTTKPTAVLISMKALLLVGLLSVIANSFCYQLVDNFSIAMSFMICREMLKSEGRYVI